MTQPEDASMQGSSELAKEFQDENYRYAYAEDFLNTSIATQIVALREQRGLNQTKLGELIGTKQPGVSRLEDVNHSTWKTETLKRIARALGVRLRISFETFGTLLIEDESFSRDFLQRPEFKDDPAFNVPGEAQETVPTHAESLVHPGALTGTCQAALQGSNDGSGANARYQLNRAMLGGMAERPRLVSLGPSPSVTESFERAARMPVASEARMAGTETINIARGSGLQ